MCDFNCQRMVSIPLSEYEEMRSTHQTFSEQLDSLKVELKKEKQSKSVSIFEHRPISNMVYTRNVELVDLVAELNESIKFHIKVKNMNLFQLIKWYFKK